ncbi:MAG: YihY/virulence factor BrkB family protein [Victivallales bacterium]|nr:YihY/virulence factor BrkB family protein [Victivallales bacterium]
MRKKDNFKKIRYETFKFFHIMRREVWSAEINECFILFRPILFLYRFFYFVFSDFANKKTVMMAAALSYATVLGIIPIVLVIVALSKGFLEERFVKYTPEIVDYFVRKLLPFFKDLPESGSGEQLYQSIQNYINTQLVPTITNLDFQQIGLYGALVLIVISLSLIRTIEKAFNDIWGVVVKTSLHKMILRYWLIIALFPAALLVILWITGFSVVHDVIKLKNQFWITKIFGDQMFTTGILCVLFAVVYKIIPNIRVRFIPALIGGIIGGTLWQINNTLSFLFVSNALRTHYLYGSIGIVPIFLVSLFVGWLIVLFGAHIAYGIQNLEFYRIRLLSTDLQPSDLQEIAVLCCAVIAIKMQNREDPPTAEELAGLSGLPFGYFSKVLSIFNERKIIYETSDDPPMYILCVSPDKIRLKEIIDTVIGNKNEARLPLVSNKKLWHASIRLCTNYRNSYSENANPTLDKIAAKLSENIALESKDHSNRLQSSPSTRTS